MKNRYIKAVFFLGLGSLLFYAACSDLTHEDPEALIGVWEISSSEETASSSAQYSSSSVDTTLLVDARDGKSYKTVVIGSQTWMAENLNYTSDSGSWCYSNDTTKCNTYGRLYNWTTATSACPEGWHLPNDAEWQTLEVYIGMGVSAADTFGWRGTDQGKKLKASVGWDSSGNGTDAYGFTALPGGAYEDQAFFGTGIIGVWWTALAADDSNSMYRSLRINYSNIKRNSYLQTSGYAVRCLKTTDQSSSSAVSSSSSLSDPVLLDTYWNTSITYGSLLDSRDGQSYRTMAIGNQTWMAQNLNFATDTGSWCNNNLASNCTIYGRLYNWATAMALEPMYNSTLWSGSDSLHQGICPEGWHMPNEAEWQTLEQTLGMSSSKLSETGWRGNQGAMLKTTNGWTNEGNGTDLFGFSALPGGFYEDTVFGSIGYYGNWKSATEYSATGAWERLVGYDTVGIERGAYGKASGASIRCVLGALASSSLEESSSSTTGTSSSSTEISSSSKAGSSSSATSSSAAASCSSVTTSSSSTTTSSSSLGASSSAIATSSSSVTPSSSSVVASSSSAGASSSAITTSSSSVTTSSSSVAKSSSSVAASCSSVATSSSSLAASCSSVAKSSSSLAPSSSSTTTPSSSVTTSSSSIAKSSSSVSPSSSSHTAIKVAAPVFSPTGGTYAPDQTITISTTTSGASIYYTLDGTIPTTSSTLYSGPFALTSSATIVAKAFKDGDTTSELTAATYTLVVTKPTISPTGGNFGEGQTIAMSTTTADAKIYYTLDGTTPTTGAYLYSGSFSLDTNATLKFFAVRDGCTSSSVDSATYIFVIPAPTLSPEGGVYTGTQSVFMTTSMSEAEIRYTTDGTEPTSSSTLYSGAVAVSQGTVLKAKTFRTGWTGTTTTEIYCIGTYDGCFADSRDNNIYPTVTIGAQTWMAENLAYLPSVSTTSTYSTNTAYYYVYGYSGTSISTAKATANYATYGVLYNWTAANSACPTGWHLPTSTEWSTLLSYVGGSSTAGTYLKATSGWTEYSGITNSDTYGFAALPGGYYYYNSTTFSSIGTYGRWWTSTIYSSTYAYYQSMSYSYAYVYSNDIYKSHGSSVRCVMDDD